MNGWTALLLLALATPACGGAKPATTPTPQTSSGSSVQRLQHDLDTILSESTLDHGWFGVLVRSLTHDETLYSLNARKLLMPASNMKIVTLAVAARELGWNYTYETDLSTSGSIHDGLLDGDLVVVGSGDPSIEAWDPAGAAHAAPVVFQRWADQLIAAGIHKITGRIVGDDRAFADEPFGIGWAWDDLDHSYGAAVGALQFNENTARFIAAPGPAAGEPASVTIEQPGTGLVIRSSVTTTSPGTAPSLVTRRLAGSPVLQVRGSVAEGAHPVTGNVSVLNPTVYFVTALRNALTASGIEVAGSAVDIDELAGPPSVSGLPLIRYTSPPLAEMAVTMMKNSQNLYAETLLRSLGGRPATFSAARAHLQAVLNGWGITPADVVIADGSGLSRNDLITPEAIATILTRVARDERLRDRFASTLPVAAVDGTLARHMIGTPAEQNVRAKTGSFSNARALSGYVWTADGEPLVFSILANNYGVPAETVEKAEDAIAVRLAQFSRR